MKSVLKTPKYNVCQTLMRRQLDDLRNTSFMSMDVSVHADTDDESDGGSGAPSSLAAAASQDQFRERDADDGDFLGVGNKEEVKEPELEKKNRRRRCKGHRRGAQPEGLPLSRKQSGIESHPPPPRRHRSRNKECQGTPQEEAPPIKDLEENQNNPPYVAPPGLEEPVRMGQVSESKASSVATPPQVLQSSGLPCLGHNGHSERARRPEPDREDPRFLMFNPNEYDAKGCCVRHPQVRLRKKKLLGSGWRVLLSACPNCCIEELYRMQKLGREEDAPSPTRGEERRPARNNHRRRSNPKRIAKTSSLDETVSLSLSSRTFGSADFLPSVEVIEKRQLKDRGRGQHKQISSSLAQAAKEVEKRKPKGRGRDQHKQAPLSLAQAVREIEERTSKGRGGGLHKQTPSSLTLAARAKDKDAAMCAVQMRHTDEEGRPGVFGGQIDARRPPHGKGTWARLDDGRVKEGERREGRCGERRSGDRRNGGGGGSRRSTMPSSASEAQARSLSGSSRRRRRPTCTGDYCH